MRQNIAFALNGFNDDMNSVQIYTVLSKPEILNNNIFFIKTIIASSKYIHVNGNEHEGN